MTSSMVGWLKQKRRQNHDSSLRSPAPHLRKSNKPPTASEAASIQAVISQAEEQLFQIGVDPDDFSGFQKDDIAKWNNIVAFIQAERAILSPLRSMPAELLTEIFTHLIHESGDLYWKPPFVVTRVCRRWRDVALSEPYLWRRVPKLVLNAKKSKSAKFITAFGAFIARSRNAPLMLEIYAPECHKHPALDILIEHSSRWENVSIQSTHATVHGLYRVRGRLPLLRKLKLDIWSSHTLQSEDNAMNAFEIAPMLTDVSLSGDIGSSLKLPWTQIHYYYELSDQNDSFRYVLHEGAQLRKLSIVSNAFVTFQALRPRVQLNFLKSINIRFGSETDTHTHQYVSLMESITTPSLEHLRVASFSPSLPHVISSLITRSLCKLQTLALHGDFSRGGLTSILRETPLLVELEACNVTSIDLVHLIASPNTLVPNIDASTDCKPTIVPLLRSLILRFDTCSGLDNEVISGLSDLARSRCELPEDSSHGEISDTASLFQRLKTFRVVVWGGVTLDFRKDMEGWRTDVVCPLSPPVLWPESVFSRVLRENGNDPISLSYPTAPTNPGLNAAKHAEAMNKFLTVLQSYPVDSSFFQKTSVHHSLYDLTRMPPNVIALEQKYKFQDRAQTLLDKWKPALLEHLKNCRWAFRGRCSLIYVASDDKVRQTAEALDIIFGADEKEMHHAALLWPGRRRDDTG